MMARLKWYLDPPSPHELKKTTNVVKVGSPLTKLSGSAHSLQTVWAFIRPYNTIRRAWSVSKLSDALMVPLKYFFEKM